MVNYPFNALSFLAQKPTTTVTLLIHEQGQHACVAGLRRTDRIFLWLRSHFLPSREKRRQKCGSPVVSKLISISISGLQAGVNQPAVLGYGVLVLWSRAESCADVTLQKKMGGNEKGSRDEMTKSNGHISDRKAIHWKAAVFSASTLLSAIHGIVRECQGKCWLMKTFKKINK